jgi:hypothetical protein
VNESKPLVEGTEEAFAAASEDNATNSVEVRCSQCIAANTSPPPPPLPAQNPTDPNNLKLRSYSEH